MALALNHAYAAKQVAKIVSESLLEFTTPIARKVARLYVVSDILYNSAAPKPHAWQYRDAFHPYLDLIFTHFRQVMHTLPGRIKAHAFRRQISQVLEVWDQWLVYPPMLLQQLREKLQ
ncbi:hypothetical protein MYAM1_003638 [Malassezia yamatoensis]|uniref:CID domain-containing protein n=1 Tax=Malassezia yamatoensis TaxID=253288 RepID=A0AAJ5Z0C8_9BASI|nr:hypothetical protein MYAM1_003638 [Malassezia yamatoensis]